MVARPRWAWLLAPFLLASAAAQRGDRADEAQPALPDSVEVPPATVRSPAEQLATFRLAPGFTIDLFAAEPLVGDPVAAALDAAGRLWVVEMRGYMNDVDGRDERAPNGRVVVLHDDDGDAVAERSTVFAEGLVLPRAVLPLRGGALVVVPPELRWYTDADGDLRAEAHSVVADGFDAGLDNPEHAGNGLLWGLDHRIHLANDVRTWRWTPRGFEVGRGAGGGQWGITQDDRGRLYFNYNEDWLRCDLLPGRYGPRAARVGGLPALNHRVCPERTVWPIRPTPGVNRGYQPGRLVDWVLAIHTAVCGPHVYRGGLLPCDGDAFVCEPAGNLVRRIVLRDHDATLRGENPYEAERAEFLASTDERFRPVNLLTGADGALYVVDMYRGVIQHRNFVTSFLRRQIERRGLERPTGLGRIWRIAPAGAAARVRPPSLHEAPVAALADALAGRNGAWRDVALRELVQRQERAAAPDLRARLAGASAPALRIALLAALAGVGDLAPTDLRAALRDDDPGVLGFALQHAGAALAAGDGHLWLQVERLAAFPAPAVRWQLALALGDAADAGGTRTAERAVAAWLRLLQGAPDDGTLRAAVATAAGDRLVALLPQVDPSGPALRDFAARVIRARQPSAQARLFAAAEADPVRAVALLRGACDALPAGSTRSGWLRFDRVPEALVALASHADRAVAGPARELLAAVALTGVAAAGHVEALTPDESQRVRAGERLFARACAACHQLDGGGMTGLAPPLRDADWVLGPPERLIRIALHGVTGPIDVGGMSWSGEMPGQRHLGDDDLAAVLSYVRRAFGHRASAIAPAQVAAERAAHVARTEPWTVEELLGTR